MLHARSDYDVIQAPPELIPEKEPCFVLRGQDEFAPETIVAWLNMVEEAGAAPEMIHAVEAHIQLMLEWQRDHGCKLPDAPAHCLRPGLPLDRTMLPVRGAPPAEPDPAILAPDEVVVYGASDDLIEVEGSLHEEFTYPEDGAILTFSDGTVIGVTYENDGLWHLRVLAHGTAESEKWEASDPDSDRYSDRVTLKGHLEWVTDGRRLIRSSSSPDKHDQ